MDEGEAGSCSTGDVMPKGCRGPSIGMTTSKCSSSSSTISSIVGIDGFDCVTTLRDRVLRRLPDRVRHDPELLEEPDKEILSELAVERAAIELRAAVELPDEYVGGEMLRGLIQPVASFDRLLSRGGSGRGREPAAVDFGRAREEKRGGVVMLFGIGRICAVGVGGRLVGGLGGCIGEVSPPESAPVSGPTLSRARPAASTPCPPSNVDASESWWGEDGRGRCSASPSPLSSLLCSRRRWTANSSADSASWNESTHSMISRPTSSPSVASDSITAGAGDGGGGCGAAPSSSVAPSPGSSAAGSSAARISSYVRSSRNFGVGVPRRPETVRFIV